MTNVRPEGSSCGTLTENQNTHLSARSFLVIMGRCGIFTFFRDSRIEKKMKWNESNLYYTSNGCSLFEAGIVKEKLPPLTETRGLLKKKTWM